jgi:hypothetical protein
MVLIEKKLRFEIMNAARAFRFDDQDRASQTFHGLSHCMKAVDFVVEFQDRCFFIEVKDPPHEGIYESDKAKDDLVADLVRKFRDTFLYRWAEGEMGKPIYFLCLVELENVHAQVLMRRLETQLPTKKIPARWKNSLVEGCLVSNIKTWNKAFPNIQITRVTGTIKN